MALFFHDYRVSHEKLKEDVNRLLSTANDDLEHQGLGDCSTEFKTLYERTLKDGLKSLIGAVPNTPDDTVWDDATTYGKEVILAPQDTERRASAPWIRSCSELYRHVIKKYGPETVHAARLGTASIIADHYGGDRRSIAHVNKKASYLRHRHEISVGAAFYPRSNPLAIGCYHSGTLPSSLALSGFLPVEKAVQAAFLSHVSVCDDYGSFTQEDYDVRLRMVALSIGVAYQYGGSFPSLFMDATCLQAPGTATDADTARSIEAAMAWRAISGCTTIYSRYNFEGGDLERSLVAPTAMVAAHDIFDWRSDVAAGNHENGISAAHGLGIAAPFHAYLETLLANVLAQPRPAVYSVGAMVYMHFTGCRYGAWEYDGAHGPGCEDCVGRLREATAAAGLAWAPKAPPRTYADGDELREWGRLWSDHFVDLGIMQEAVGWFQYLVASGRIWLFDVLADGTCPVDDDTDWA